MTMKPHDKAAKKAITKMVVNAPAKLIEYTIAIHPNAEPIKFTA